MKRLTKSHQLSLLFLLTSLSVALAQKQTITEDVKGDKIHIELKNEKDGEERTFERDYDSREEMLADQDLKDFLDEEDLNVYFYGGNELKGSKSYAFSFPHVDDDQIHILSDVDSLLSFHFNGPGSYQFGGKNGGTFLFSMPDEGANDVWMFGGGDSVFARKMTPIDIDSIKVHWKNHFEEEPGKAFLYEWSDDESDGQRTRVFLHKKVTISRLDQGEEVLDKMSSGKMSELEPLELSYYPNPSSGRFTLKMKLAETKPLQVSVTDLAGQMIYDEEIRAFDGNYSREFDLSEKPSGIYLLQVVQGNSRLVRKIMIN